MYYLIGDIHGYVLHLVSLFRKLENFITEDDKIIFLGDYVDRGEYSFEVVDYLIALSKRYDTVFLKGNHEDMMLKYLNGQDENGIYFINGGEATARSYVKNYGKFKLPGYHQTFFNNLELYYEGEDFIAVHAGLNPRIDKLEDQEERDLLWIREQFFRANKRWEKTIVFGHTPTNFLSHDDLVYNNTEKNIIGIDSGVIYGRAITCLRWPDQEVVHSE